MRWDELFADLEGQLEAGLTDQEQEAAAEDERLRLGRLTLRDRIAAIATVREPVRIRIADGSVIDIVVRTVGRDWVAGDLAAAAQGVLPLSAVTAVLPTAAQRASSTAPPPSTALTDRLGVAFVLRDLARRRRQVQLTTRGGLLTGTLDRVGRDHLELAVHAPDDWRRQAAVARIELVPLSELLLVRVD